MDNYLSQDGYYSVSDLARVFYFTVYIKNCIDLYFLSSDGPSHYLLIPVPEPGTFPILLVTISELSLFSHTLCIITTPLLSRRSDYIENCGLQA